MHVHAGIGWEGHALVSAARKAGVGAVIRTEHLPYTLRALRQPALERLYARAPNPYTTKRILRLLRVADQMSLGLRADADTLPMSRWAKLAMMFQSAVSLVTVALVVSRAVNILT